MKILVTAKYVSGTTNEGGSSRFMSLVGKTLHDIGHEVIMSSRPSDVMTDQFDLIICSHGVMLETIRKNPAPKVFISHGIIEDEYMTSGADRYIAVSEEVQKFNIGRGIKSEVIPQPINIGIQTKPNSELKNILIIRRYEMDYDPFAFLSEKYNVKVSDPNIPIEDQIQEADLCITIGRGVLESFAQGKPVIVADNRKYIGAFGDGYVDAENITEIAKNNFSGRRFKNPLTCEWIESELAKYNPEDSDFLYNYVQETHDAKKIVLRYLEEINKPLKVKSDITVGICAIIKDCYKPYLLEWFNHHHSIGIDHFFIYDNESEIPIQKIVNNLSFQSDIHIETITGTTKQLAAYNKCLDDIKSGILPLCDKVAFIDDDEFIICENGDIKSTLAEYSEFSGLGINWRIFGSSGIKGKTPEPQISKFTQHTTIDFQPNRHIKSIVNPLTVERTSWTPHCFNYSKGNCVNVNKETIEDIFSEPVYEKIWLDHYFTRSLEEWGEKTLRGRSDINLIRTLAEFYDIDFNCSGRKTNKIHLVMPFYRAGNLEKLIDAYRPMNVILHTIVFEDEYFNFSNNELWIHGNVIFGMKSTDCKVQRPECFKRNWFIKNCEINDDDYYVCVDDDDMYEPNVFNEVSKMDDDIVITSMKRGYQIPKDASPLRQYHTNTLIAHPDNVEIAKISGQQLFVKGKIFKEHLFDEESYIWDGPIAVHYKESGEQIAYRPDLFALFNYYEQGRWEKSKVSFGVMVNDPVRLDMVFGQSQLEGSAHIVKAPDSATKGLNGLLDIMEAEGAEIGVLCHQDMYFRAGWVEQLKSQIKILPESWVVCGVIGKDMKGNICGKFHDMRMPLNFDTSNLHNFPHPASCFDECVIIVNMKKKFRFDESLEGFDLYGTLCVLQTWESGGTAWIVDCWCEHFILRPFQWFPSVEFQERFKVLYDKYHHLGRVDTTVIGFMKEDEVT